MRIGLRFTLLILFAFSSTFLFATTYTFTGSGAWAEQANWAGGFVPHNAGVGDTIRINGIATTTDVCNEFGCQSDIPGNDGTIIIAIGASLTISNPTQFSSGGTIIVYGTLINKTTWEGYPSQNIIINGTLINKNLFGNYGSITINEGGTIQNEGGLHNYHDEFLGRGLITLNIGGTINNLSSFWPDSLINNGGTIVNTGTVGFACDITGDFGTNPGTLTPGSASITAVYNITGDYTATNTAVHSFKIAGATEGSYDGLNVGGIVTLNGTLNVSLINGFAPTTNHDIPIIKGIISGKFTTVNIPNRYTLIYNTNSVVLRSIPLQPVTFNSFTVQRSNNTAILSWSVQNEQDALQYEVERSIDGGSTYTKIGTVNAANAGQYSFTDAQPQTTNYYRIKCLHKDGFYRYSNYIIFYLPTTVNTFNGEGNWSDASKWSEGTVPNTLFSGQQLVINGTCKYDLLEFDNNGQIFIPSNSTLILDRSPSNKTWFINFTGRIIVEGTLENRADKFENDGDIQVFGTFINETYFFNSSYGLTIEDGGKFINTTGSTILSDPITIKGSGAFINKGKVGGNVTFEGNLSNYGILAPGNSPGTVQVNGDYTATPTAIHNFEVSGTANGEYDLLRVTGAINLDGVLNVSLINGYTPGKADEIPIMQGTINGTFSKVNLPASYTLVYTSTAVLLKSVEALPVHFIDFDIKKTGSGTLLIWKVAGEINVKRYEVERSNDGRHFTSIGFVDAIQNTTYSYTDTEVLQGAVYYRIKSVDMDGTYNYSSILSIQFETPLQTLKAFPMPAQQFVTLRHHAAGIKLIISLYTQDGRMIKQMKPALGATQTQLDLLGLASGLYLIRLDYGNGIIETVKVVKQ